SGVRQAQLLTRLRMASPRFLRRSLEGSVDAIEMAASRCAGAPEMAAAAEVARVARAAAVAAEPPDVEGRAEVLVTLCLDRADMFELHVASISEPLTRVARNLLKADAMRSSDSSDPMVASLLAAMESTYRADCAQLRSLTEELDRTEEGYNDFMLHFNQLT